MESLILLVKKHHIFSPCFDPHLDALDAEAGQLGVPAGILKAPWCLWEDYDKPVDLSGLSSP